MFISVPLPDARRASVKNRHEEIAALVRIITEGCPGPDGAAPKLEAIADRLGLSRSALYAYMQPPRSNRARHNRPTPFPVVYALRALATNLQATSRSLWGADA